MGMLCVYGSLAPGEVDHWMLSRVAGEWTVGTVHGYLFEITWGPAQGYQGFIADETGSAVSVHVLESDQLEVKWREIDDFHGAGYDRVTIALTRGQEVHLAAIYQARSDS